MLRRDVLHKLYYDERLSMWDIAKVLSVTPATVVYWMKKHGLRRRSRSECAYVKQNPEGDPFRIKSKLNKKDKELLLSGLMLYWAEGSRKSRHAIQIANLDYRLLLLFTKFLRRICGLRKDKFRLLVRVYRKFNREKARDYWSRILKIPRSLISVYIHSDKRSKPHRQWSKYGIARIEVRNIKLKQYIDEELERYLSKWV